MDVTRKQFLDTCREVRSEFPEGRNPTGQNDDVNVLCCMYTKSVHDTSDAQPHCFIGTVMLRLGLPLPGEFRGPYTLPPSLQPLANRMQAQADGFDSFTGPIQDANPRAWRTIDIPEE